MHLKISPFILNIVFRDFLRGYETLNVAVDPSVLLKLSKSIKIQNEIDASNT